MRRPGRDKGAPKGIKQTRAPCARRIYPKRAKNFRESLTPSRADKSCRPRGAFSVLRDKLAGGPFAALREGSAVRAANELNGFMRETTRNAASPKRIKDELKNVQRLASALAAAVDDLHGVSASVLLGAEDPTAPYLSRSPGSESSSRGREEKYKVAFGPYLQALAEIEAREANPNTPWSSSLARETKDEAQLALLDRYSRAIAARALRWRSMNQGLAWSEYTPPQTTLELWRGPPAREVLLDPLRDQIDALGVLAETAHRAASSALTVRGRRALATDAWEFTYAKICWRCVQAEFGNDRACGLSADKEGDFVSFVRALATFASGEKIKSGFGGVVAEVLAWGKKMAEQEGLSEQFLNGRISIDELLLIDELRRIDEHRRAN